MSSVLTGTHPRVKKRPRIQKACNECRAKKVKCVSGDNDRCMRCISYDKPCTGKTPTLKKQKQDEVALLQRKLQQMQSALEHISTAENLQNNALSQSANSPDLVGTPFSDSGDDTSCVDDYIQPRTDSVPVGITNLLGTIGHHFFGQSSGMVFLNRALGIKRSMTRYGDDPVVSTLVQPEPMMLDVVDTFDDSPSHFLFPEPDLLIALVNTYFDHVNVYLPLLHRPSFEANVSAGLHLRSRHFAEVLLLVAASAARFSTDPRVRFGAKEDGWTLSGWQWFSQVQLLPRTLVRVSGLYELQKICLAGCYLHGTSTPQVIWSLVGVGLRLAQERGIHRRKRPGHVWTAEDELWKRAFWILICVDRLSCSVLGRPCSLHDEDFDAELPAMCDDEYWDNDDPAKAFKQPEGQPSQLAFFVTLIRLTDILAFTLRTVYAVGKFKTLMSKSNRRWQEEIVHKIDSVLNNWHDAIPQFLRWPSRPDSVTFYHQSASLYLTYYYVQILAHRPFIPSIHGHSELSLPSLLICANAARSCSHVLEALGADPYWLAQPFCGPIAFTSGIFLLIHIWEAEKFGFSIDSARDLQGARSCLVYLQALKGRLYLAIRFANLLQHLIDQEDLSNAKAPHTTPASTPSSSNELGSSIESQPTCGLSSIPPSTELNLADGQGQQQNDLTQLWYTADDEYVDDWGFNDITMLQNLGSGDTFYRDMFASYNVPIPGASNFPAAQPSDDYGRHQWMDPLNQVTNY